METKISNNTYLNFSGCSQASRHSNILKEGYVSIDEKSFTDNLVYAYALSKLINYFDSNGQLDGDWSEFLIDEAVVLAAISSIDPTEIESKFKINHQKTLSFNSIEKKQKYLDLTFSNVFHIAKKIDVWYNNLKIVEDFINDEVNIRNEIANNIINKLQFTFQKFKSFALGAEPKTAINKSYSFDFDSFGTIWGLDGITPSDLIYEGKNKAEKINNACDALQIVFQDFYESIIYIRQKARDYLEQSLESDHHFPEVALLLAFLDLYKYPQAQINQLSKRYQEYYYINILQQQKRIAKNSEVYLSFTLDNNIPKAIINKGEKFIAGSDSKGKSIFFETDFDFEVNRAQLQSLKNIFLEKTKIEFGNKTIDFVDNIFCSNIPVSDRQGKDNTTAIKSTPIFGERQKGRGDNDRNMDFSQIGFAIASPALYLNEGLREIDIILNFKESAYKNIKKQLVLYSKYLGISYKEMTVKALIDAFRIELTAQTGWLNIKRNVVTLDDDKNSIVIKFNVTEEQPGIIGIDKAIHEEELETIYPVARVFLNSKSYLYPYFLLENGEIEQIAVKTAVTGVKNLVIQNNLGSISPDSPFVPFGPMPTTGSYMLIGNNEVFQKHLEDLKLNIEWFEVPKTNRGFSEHYAEYGTAVDNTSFEAKVSVLDSGKWKPDLNEDKQTVKLFRTFGKEGKDEPDAESVVSEILPLHNLDIGKIRQEANYTEIPNEQVYTNLSKRGFIKLELTAPKDAFGHFVYPNILSDITINNAKTGILKGSKKKPLPLAPLTPTIKSITLDYKSSSVISIKDSYTSDVDVIEKHGQLFHLHAFGREKIYPNSSINTVNLIPKFDFEGALFLGFKDIDAPQTVSILFEMLDEFTISSEEEPPAVEWHFLANNTWHQINPSNIVRDDTNGFLRTGIIMIKIPQDISKSNTVLDKDLYWLRVGVTANVEGASNLISTASQVVKATLIGNQEIYESEYLKKDLPLNTIQRPLRNLKGVKTVNQPLSSFNGQAYENEVNFQTRISERLRHRDRAVTCWDYERLVLDNFLQIERVTCLPNMTSMDMSSPGNVLLVVSPYPEKVVNKKEPRTSSELLYEIKSFLKNYISPFVSVEVRNPSYERIRVICSVKFTESHNKGFYMQQLNKQINNYLSGNMGSDSHGTLVGKVVYCSDVLTYIRTLPYIQFVTKFSIVQVAIDISGNYVLLDTANEEDKKDGLQATKPWSVLVPSDNHQIEVLSGKEEENPLQAGIEDLELGGDFIINE